jgi:sugar-specific transcriptional regulator TrmB
MISRLRGLDLPSHEALVYLTLLMHPNLTAGALCTETGIPDSKIYYALDGLSKRGVITVQRGNPNIYQPVPPKDAIANLKQQLTENFNEKIREADALIDMLAPIHETAEKPGQLEVAYIIRGQKNMINRMKTLIEAAQREVTIFVAVPEVFSGLKASLLDAKDKRRVKLNLALTREVYESGDCSGLGEIRLLCCSIDQSISSLGMLISDMKTLLTVSNWGEETAMLTQDPNLIRATRDYYDSPTCCTRVR